jgi:indoleamine 2,3-dioxygenase
MSTDSHTSGAHAADGSWAFSRSHGFLLEPDPVADLRTAATGLEAEAVRAIQELGDAMPVLVTEGRIRGELDQLPALDMSPAIAHGDGRVLERLFQIYAHAANAYVWCEQDNPASEVPVGVAVPLVELADALGRPPVLAYASTSLSNYERIDPTGDLSVDNLRCIQELIGTQDESWFHLIHVEIEWHAAEAVAGCLDAAVAASTGDTDEVARRLAPVPEAFDRMIATFKRIGEGCSPDYYFRTLRPYLFGFTDVVYTGVEAFNGEPQTFRGESGAQSTIIPTIQRLLGLQHREGGLTADLEAMIDYMPVPHQHVLAGIDSEAIRPHVVAAASPELTDVYNACLQQVLDFRSLHLNMARSYVASRLDDPTGTGGTEFMPWLTQLRDEIKEQML